EARARDLDPVSGGLRDRRPLQVDGVGRLEVVDPVVGRHLELRGLGNRDLRRELLGLHARGDLLPLGENDRFLAGRDGRLASIGRDLGFLSGIDVHGHARLPVDRRGRRLRRDRRARRGRVDVDCARDHLDLASAAFGRARPAHLEERARADRVERAVGEHDLRGARPAGLDEVAVEEALPLARRPERVAPGGLDGNVSFDRDERRVARLVRGPAAQRPPRVGLRIHREPERGVPVLLAVGLFGALEKLAGLRQVRSRPRVARRGGGALDQVGRAGGVGGGAGARGAPGLLANEEGDAAQHEGDQEKKSPETDRPDRDDEPVEVRADRLARLSPSLKHRDLRDLSSSLIAQRGGRSVIVGGREGILQHPRPPSAYRPRIRSAIVACFQKSVREAPPMLKTMRNSFHHLKWTLFAVIIVFILGFVYFSGSGTGSGDVTGQVVAKIGGETISASEFDRRYRTELERQQAQYQGKLSPELIRALNIPRHVPDGMIARNLRGEDAKRLSLKVTDEEVARAVTAFPELQENGQFVGSEKYERALRASGYTPERFEEEVREGLLLQKYSSMIKASVL